MPIHLEPIGFVRSPRTGLEDDHWGDVEAQIELSHGISAEALDGIEGFTHGASESTGRHDGAVGGSGGA